MEKIIAYRWGQHGGQTCGFKEEFLFCCGWTREPEEVSEINDTAFRKNKTIKTWTNKKKCIICWAGMSFWLSSCRARLVWKFCCSEPAGVVEQTPQLCKERLQRCSGTHLWNQEESASLPGHSTQLGLELLALQALRQCFGKFHMRKCNCQILPDERGAILSWM